MWLNVKIQISKISTLKVRFIHANPDFSCYWTEQVANALASKIECLKVEKVCENAVTPKQWLHQFAQDTRDWQIINSLISSKDAPAKTYIITLYFDGCESPLSQELRHFFEMSSTSKYTGVFWSFEEVYWWDFNKTKEIERLLVSLHHVDPKVENWQDFFKQK